MIKGIPEMENPLKYNSSDFCGSGFVELTGGNGIDVNMQYPVRGLSEAEEKCLVREEVRERLLQANAFLPEGIHLRIWDAWRPFKLQEELYNIYAEDLVERFQLKDLTEEDRQREIEKYISYPSYDRDCPPVHTTGGAVDVTLIDDSGRELDMGTEFDSFSEMAHTAYFEKYEGEIRDNRRMLYHAMTKAGFTNLPSEWWHYDYGDRFWAYYFRKPAIYRGVFTREEIC